MFQWKLKVHTFQILSCARRRAHTRAPILQVFQKKISNFQKISKKVEISVTMGSTEETHYLSNCVSKQKCFHKLKIMLFGVFHKTTNNVAYFFETLEFEKFFANFEEFQKKYKTRILFFANFEKLKNKDFNFYKLWKLKNKDFIFYKLWKLKKEQGF